MRSRYAAGIAVLSLVMAGCGGGGGSGAPAPSLALSKPTGSGDAQTAEVGHSLTLPIKVLVKLDTALAAGQTITWNASSGGSANPTTSQSGVDGVASTTWTLGAGAGSQSLTATLSGAGGSPLTYAATAIAPAIVKPGSNGDQQTDTVHATLATPLTVEVTLSGVPQSGRTIIWGTGNAGGTVTAVDTTATTTGFATAHWKLGTVAGAQAATAATAGAAAGVTFSATALPGLAKTLQKASGDSQTADTLHAYQSQLVVKAVDQFGNARSGATVQWVVTTANATVLPTSDTTLANGTAATTLTSGAATGAVTVTATSSGLGGSPVTFGATISHAPTIHTIQVGDDFFNSDSITIKAGDEVRWQWGPNTVTHNVTSDGPPSFTSSVNMGANAVYGPITFATPGTYYYYCTIHGTSRATTHQGMIGVIVVQ